MPTAQILANSVRWTSICPLPSPNPDEFPPLAIEWIDLLWREEYPQVLVKIVGTRPLDMREVLKASSQCRKWLPAYQHEQLPTWRLGGEDMTFRDWLLTRLLGMEADWCRDDQEGMHWFGNLLPSFDLCQRQAGWPSCDELAELVVHLGLGISGSDPMTGPDTATRERILASYLQEWGNWRLYSWGGHATFFMAGDDAHGQPDNMERYYTLLFAAVCYQHMRLTYFLDRTTGQADEEIDGLRRNFIKFRRHHLAHRLTTYGVGDSVYQFLRNSSRIPQIQKEIEEEIRVADEAERLDRERLEGLLTLLLSIMAALLDDPQSLFDEDNQVRLAKGLVAGLEGFAPFILSFDRVFADRVCRAGNMQFGAPVSDKVARLEIVARSDDGRHTRLKAHEVALVAARRTWQVDKSDSGKIIRYCSTARKFMEQTLVALLHDSGRPVSGHPTLQPLGQELRSLTEKQGTLQSLRPFKDFVAMLPAGAPEHQSLNDALNWSHHFNDDALRQHHAQAVEAMMDRFLGLRDQCLEVLFHGRAPLPEKPFLAGNVARIGIPDIGRIAAADADGDAQGAGDDVGEELRLIDPEGHRAVVAGGLSKWLPFIADDTVLIVENAITSRWEGGDWALVWDRQRGQGSIGVLGKAGAREQVVLMGQGGLFRIHPAGDVEVRRIAGGLFRLGEGRRTPLEAFDLTGRSPASLHAIEVSVGDSAEPFLRRGDRALVGDVAALATLSAAAPGYAFRLSDGRQVLKRFQDSGMPPGYWQLLPLSGQGDGVVVAQQDAGGSGAPHILEARPLIGFWRS